MPRRLAGIGLSSLVCGVFLCFLPLLLNLNFKRDGYGENVTILSALSSIDFHYSLVARIAVLIPIVCETVADTIFLSDVVVGQSTLSYLDNRILKWTLILSFLIPDLVMLTYVVPNKYIEDIPPIISSQQSMIFFCLTSFASNYGPNIWKPSHVTLLFISFTFGKACESIIGFDFRGHGILNLIKLLCYVFGSIGFLYLTFVWSSYIWKKSKYHSLTLDEYCCNIYVLSMVIGFLGLWIIYFIYGSTSWANVTSEFLISLSYVVIFHNLINTLWSGRILRKQLHIQKSTQELETKRMFVRYVSHEIRTPLNTVAMGLQLLRSELPPNVTNESILEVVEDLHVSCETAVDILNDLLTYEKLTTNILQLDSAVIPIKPFLLEVVHPFYMQARLAGIDLSVVFSNELLDESMVVRIYGDKSKLSQVVRNLLSNSLKFTKRGGRVAVLVNTVFISHPSNRVGVNFNPSPKEPHQSPSPLSQLTGLFSSTRSRNGSGLEESPADDVNSYNEAVVDNSKSSGVNLRSTFKRSISAFSVFSAFSTHLSRESGHRQEVEVLQIEVVDSGAGISQENQKRLFKEIVQFNPAELQDGKGSGLGLWISKRIMDLHGGELTVFSDGVGRGSTFTFCLPVHETITREISNVDSAENISGLNVSRTSPLELETTSENMLFAMQQLELQSECTDDGGLEGVQSQDVHPYNNPTHRDEKRETSLNSRTIYLSTPKTIDLDKLALRTSFENAIGQRRVLLVDDAIMNRKMLNRLLRDKFAQISEAEDGKQALDMVLTTLQDPSQPVFDVIIMDYVMPVMDGPTAVLEMRAAGYKGIVIGLTGNALPADIQFFLSTGADRVMIKPCDIEDLLRILEELMFHN